MDIARATGRMLNGPFVNEWTLHSFAMCAKPSGNIHVEGTLSQSNTASRACESGRVHGPGGGGGLIDGGSVHLREIFVGPTLREPVRVTFTSTPPPSIGTIVHMTCAT